MAFGGVDFNYFLGRKYAALQQQADATTQNAATAAITGAAQANNLNADAALTGVRTQLLPGESASAIGLQGAQRNLLTEQASIVRPESIARIANLDATTEGIGNQNKAFVRTNLTDSRFANSFDPNTGLYTGAKPVTQPSILGPGGFKLPSATKPPRLPGESAVAYMDRTGWGL